MGRLDGNCLLYLVCLYNPRFVTYVKYKYTFSLQLFDIAIVTLTKQQRYVFSDEAVKVTVSRQLHPPPLSIQCSAADSSEQHHDQS